MLKDVLAFDPLNEQLINKMLESNIRSELVPVCPKDWVRISDKSNLKLIRATSLNTKFRDSSSR
jgi:hypothetical protein